MCNGNQDTPKNCIFWMFAVYKTSQKKNFFPNTLQKYVVKVQRKYSKNTVNCTSTTGTPRPIFGREGWCNSGHISGVPPLPLSIPKNPGKAEALGAVYDALVTAMECQKCRTSTLEMWTQWKIVLLESEIICSVFKNVIWKGQNLFIFYCVKHATLSRRKKMFCRRRSSSY